MKFFNFPYPAWAKKYILPRSNPPTKNWSAIILRKLVASAKSREAEPNQSQERHNFLPNDPPKYMLQHHVHKLQPKQREATRKKRNNFNTDDFSIAVQKSRCCVTRQENHQDASIGWKERSRKREREKEGGRERRWKSCRYVNRRVALGIIVLFFVFNYRWIVEEISAINNRKNRKWMAAPVNEDD